jgi:hypothetical protein
VGVGILQGLMWRAYTSLGFLEYSFIETVEAMHPFYIIRALGGALFLIGALIMAYNLWMTVRVGEAEVVAPSLFSRRNEEQRNVILDTPQIFEKNSIVLIVGILAGDRDRRPGRDHAAVLPQEHDREVDGIGPTRRSSSPAATSMSARAAISAIRR